MCGNSPLIIACFSKSDTTFPNDFSFRSGLKFQNPLLSTKYHFEGIRQVIYQLSVDDLALELGQIDVGKISFYASDIFDT